jgi:hypothetical protein
MTQELVELRQSMIEGRDDDALKIIGIASISDAVIQIAKLNLKDNQTSYYIKSDEWRELLAEAIEMAIRPASAEIFGGTSLHSYQLHSGCLVH